MPASTVCRLINKRRVLYNGSKFLRQADILQFGCLFEPWCNRLGSITRDAAADRCHKEAECGILSCAGSEPHDGLTEILCTFHSRQGIASACQSFPYTPFCTKVFIRIAGGTASVHAMDITAEYKYLVLSQQRDPSG